MQTVTSPSEDWRAVIAMLREKALPSVLALAKHLERQLEQHEPAQTTVPLSLTDDVVVHSSSWARWQLAQDLSANSLHHRVTFTMEGTGVLNRIEARGQAPMGRVSRSSGAAGTAMPRNRPPCG